MTIENSFYDFFEGAIAQSVVLIAYLRFGFGYGSDFAVGVPLDFDRED
ncbi:MAG: hypothetical protein JJT94_04125 [Bernardetiaceae bacterium]|nr:hypothetical protein [Bernardetiaceae bacterium]